MQRWRAFWRSLRAWQRVTLTSVGVLLFLFVFFVISFETVHYTESTQFCSSCHNVMEPEIVAHRVSAHANVACGDCHIGPGIEWKLYYKASALRYLWTLPLNLYKRPLDSPRETMRSTDQICEQCHTPENYQSVELRTANRYETDENNSFHRLLMAIKIGNGIDNVAGLGLGAHWHIANPVTFIATDDLRQEIPWVQVERAGERVTYVDSEADPALWQNTAVTLTMDCIDCHTRDGHMVRKPAQLIDDALANDRIPADLPYVKAQTQAVLAERYADKTEGMQAINTTLRSFYETQYPALYTERQADIERTIDEVQSIYDQTYFPFMQVFWDTYPDNVGHEDFPGCMRCHDGNHLNAQGEAIPAECNLCHAVPQVYGPDESRPAISIAIGDLPESHLSSHWLAEHRFRFDATCDDCHTVGDPGGVSNSSFCSNSGCHAREWNYLRIDTPAVLAQVVPTAEAEARRLPRIPHPLVEPMDCLRCHGPERVLAYPADHAEYSQEECTDCHRLAPGVLAEMTPPPAVAVAPPTPGAPAVSHALPGNENCLACHAVTSNIAPAPANHLGFSAETCLECHRLAPEFAAIRPPTPLPTATALPLPTTTVTPTLAATEAATATTAISPTATVQTQVQTPAATAPVTVTPTAAATPTPVVSPTLAEPLPAETLTATVTAAATLPSTQSSLITHPVTGNENCLACHAVTSNIAPAPANHAGFGNELCQDCHLPAP